MNKINMNLSHRTGKVNFTDEEINLLEILYNKENDVILQNIIEKIKTIKESQDSKREYNRVWAEKNKEKRNEQRRLKYKENKKTIDSDKSE